MAVQCKEQTLDNIILIYSSLQKKSRSFRTFWGQQDHLLFKIAENIMQYCHLQNDITFSIEKYMEAWLVVPGLRYTSRTIL